ncbi:uncharacterized protein LOC116344815 isoform X2 [Contarinia nasturtii]|uniref:uncharacterized protein LOC116344815 isoform X2 n=1 Tax=Contarinia nasturtii TaxID=265458 RepID=UPI0012D43557|nr:uncharacterized protein LOC116344815 isoform X2 [Contarinia nasturtii]
MEAEVAEEADITEMVVIMAIITTMTVAAMDNIITTMAMAKTPMVMVKTTTTMAMDKIPIPMDMVKIPTLMAMVKIPTPMDMVKAPILMSTELEKIKETIIMQWAMEVLVMVDTAVLGEVAELLVEMVVMEVTEALMETQMDVNKKPSQLI